MPIDVVIPQYEQRTEDVVVRVEPEFLAEQSNPSDSRFIWAYTVEIDNQSDRDLTVTDRFWQIADSRGQVQETFTLFESEARTNAVFAGYGIRNFISKLQVSNLTIVSHSLGARVVLSCLFIKHYYQ